MRLRCRLTGLACIRGLCDVLDQGYKDATRIGQEIWLTLGKIKISMLPECFGSCLVQVNLR
jgi:hypothetical protein